MFGVQQKPPAVVRTNTNLTSLIKVGKIENKPLPKEGLRKDRGTKKWDRFAVSQHGLRAANDPSLYFTASCWLREGWAEVSQGQGSFPSGFVITACYLQDSVKSLWFDLSSYLQTIFLQGDFLSGHLTE